MLGVPKALVQVPGPNSLKKHPMRDRERWGGRLGTLKGSPLCTLNLLLYFLESSHDRVPTTR